MKTVLRITLFAATGWLTGELISHTVLAVPATVIPPPRVPAIEERVVQRSEWQEFLTVHAPAAPAAPLTAAALSPKTLGTPGELLAASRRLTTATLEEFPGILDSIGGIVDIRLRRQAAEAFFAAWAEKDPRAAMAAVSTYPSITTEARLGTLRAWSERDPAGLLTWLRADTEAGGWIRVEAELSAVPFLLARIPEETMSFAVEILPRRNLLGTAFNEWRSRDSAAADAWRAAAPPDVKKSLAKSIEETGGPMSAAH